MKTELEIRADYEEKLDQLGHKIPIAPNARNKLIHEIETLEDVLEIKKPHRRYYIKNKRKPVINNIISGMIK